jgi:hypothetical protein
LEDAKNIFLDENRKLSTIDEGAGAGAGGGGGPAVEEKGTPAPPFDLKYSSSRAISAGSSFSSIVVMSESPRSFSRSVTRISLLFIVYKTATLAAELTSARKRNLPSRSQLHFAHRASPLFGSRDDFDLLSWLAAAASQSFFQR